MESLLVDAAVLMLTGMGVVFTFLTVLVFSTQGLSRFAQWLKPEDTPDSLRSQTVSTQSTSQIDPNVVAAVSVALHQHRHNSKG